MSFSYTGNPDSSAKDAVRFYVGDTNPKEPLLQDEEIAYFLKQYHNAITNTAIRCCETIMAKFSRMADESVGQVRVNYSQRVTQYREMRQDLTRRLATGDMTPFVGGMSKSEMDLDRQNTDLVQPDFTKHMMENNQISPWVTNSYNSWLWYLQ